MSDPANPLSGEDLRVSDVPGRLGKIIDTVRDLFNEDSSGFISDGFIIRAVNRCKCDLAAEDCWNAEFILPAEAGVASVDLGSAIPSFERLHRAAFGNSSVSMIPLYSYRDYAELRGSGEDRGVPEYYFRGNATLYVLPTPAHDLERGYFIHAWYTPEDVTPAAADPPIPEAHDMVFVYFALKAAFLRDRHAPGADLKYQEYSSLYEWEKRRLLGQTFDAAVRLRS